MYTPLIDNEEFNELFDTLPEIAQSELQDEIDHIELYTGYFTQFAFIPVHNIAPRPKGRERHIMRFNWYGIELFRTRQVPSLLKRAYVTN